MVGTPVMAPSIAGQTAVRFGDGRRPETRTQVRMAEFDGPLALLLSLIEARQLDGHDLGQAQVLPAAIVILPSVKSWSAAVAVPDTA